jgi:hypothetical protein
MRKEKQYGTRINYVAVRSTAGSDRSVVSVQYSLASLRRIGRVSRAAVRPMRLISHAAPLLPHLPSVHPLQLSLGPT